MRSSSLRLRNFSNMTSAITTQTTPTLVYAPITSPSVARSMIPMHTTQPGYNPFTVSPGLADLQWFRPSEVATAKTLASVPGGQISNFPASAVTMLEYGFGARNASGTGRVIAASNGATCTVAACKGRVAFSYTMLMSSVVANQPYKYTTWFLVARESVDAYSQHPTEAGGLPSATAVESLAGVSNVAGLLNSSSA
jgi:hypothetical protein